MGIVSAVVLINGATGSHGGHSQLHTTSMMKGVFFLSFATIAAGAGTYETELLRGIDIYNFRSKCWGKSNVDKYAVDMENAKRECMQMLFFKCADRTERRVCTEAQLLENLETFYGSESDEETAERIASIGLPENKYDAA